MPVHAYRSREQFMLEHPAIMEKADALVSEEPTSCIWQFDHALYDKRRRQYVVAYASQCSSRPEPCILTIEIRVYRGKLSTRVYQRFE